MPYSTDTLAVATSFSESFHGIEPLAPVLLGGAQLGLQPLPGQSDGYQAFLHEWQRGVHLSDDHR